MDKGSHFHKSDFQVHTPVDPQWSGNKPQNETEWKVFGSKLIQACRDKELFCQYFSFGGSFGTDYQIQTSAK